MSPNRRGWHRPRAGLVLSLVVAGLVAAGRAGADEPTAEAVREYARAVTRAQELIDAGQPAEARKTLAATDKGLRSFEYDYLLARAAAPKDAPPGLVRTLVPPKVETRYGVLNEVDRRLVFICRDGSLRVYDLSKPEAEPKTVPHAGGAVWSGAFTHDGKTFAAGYENGEVVMWDAGTWKPRHVVPLGGKWAVRELAVAPDGSAFVAETEKALELWSLAGEKPAKVAAVGERYNFGEGLAFSPKGDLIATGGMFDIDLYDAKTGAKGKGMRHASYTMGLEFSPDGKRVASAPRGNVNKFLSVFDIAEGKPLFIAGPFPDYIAGLAFTPDGKRVAATGCEKKVRLFDATTGAVTLTLPRPECSAKPGITRDGRLLGWSEPAGYRYIDLGPPPAAGK